MAKAKPRILKTVPTIVQVDMFVASFGISIPRGLKHIASNPHSRDEAPSFSVNPSIPRLERGSDHPLIIPYFAERGNEKGIVSGVSCSILTYASAWCIIQSKSMSNSDIIHQKGIPCNGVPFS